MNGRRFEHPDKARFFEVYWEGGNVEITSGSLGSKGRTREHDFGLARDRDAFIEAEIAKRLREGFLEIVPEAVRAATAIHIAPQPVWLAEIAAAYDDDAPRLVYADSLQAQGDPRGELITAQCALARLDPTDPRHAILRERVDTLLVTYRARWLPRGTEAQCTFHRGFVERVALDMRMARDDIAAVFAAAPLVRTLELDHEQHGVYWASLAPPWTIVPPEVLRQLTGLDVRGWRMQTPWLQALMTGPELAGIERLALRTCGITAGPMTAVLGERAWRSLDLHGNVLGTRGTKGVLANVARLEVLDLGNAGVGDPGAQLIAEAPFTRLRRLRLDRSNLTAAGLDAIARASHLATLEALDVSGNTDIDGLFRDPVLPALVELDLHATELDDDGLTSLLASPLAAQLRSLDVSGNQLTDARLFLEAELPALRVLNVSGNALGARVREIKAGLPQVRVIARNAAGD